MCVLRGSKRCNLQPPRGKGYCFACYSHLIQHVLTARKSHCIATFSGITIFLKNIFHFTNICAIIFTQRIVA